MANQINGFTIDYGKFILKANMYGLFWLVMLLGFSPERKEG